MNTKEGGVDEGLELYIISGLTAVPIYSYAYSNPDPGASRYGPGSCMPRKDSSGVYEWLEPYIISGLIVGPTYSYVDPNPDPGASTYGPGS